MAFRQETPVGGWGLSRAGVWAFPYCWPAGPVTHCWTEIPGPQLPKTVHPITLLVMGQGPGDGFTARAVTTTNETVPVAGIMWVFESEDLGSNPSSGTSQLCGWLASPPVSR